MKNISYQIITGIVILLLGVLLLLSKLDLLYFPKWFFSWPNLLILTGVLIGFRHRFTNASSLVLIFVGGYFLAARLIEEPNIAPYFWPVLLIAGGLWFIFSPRNYINKKTWEGVDFKIKAQESEASGEDVIKSTVLFSGVKKKINSKSFRGGESVNIFGGTDLDLS